MFGCKLTWPKFNITQDLSDESVQQKWTLFMISASDGSRCRLVVRFTLQPPFSTPPHENVAGLMRWHKYNQKMKVEHNNVIISDKDLKHILYKVQDTRTEFTSAMFRVHFWWHFINSSGYVELKEICIKKSMWQQDRIN